MIITEFQSYYLLLLLSQRARPSALLSHTDYSAVAHICQHRDLLDFEINQLICLLYYFLIL